jgi:predicted amidophosphoribosyltransferase
MSGTTSADELLRVVGIVGDAHALCRACGSPAGGGYLACPHCGERLGGTCRQCRRPLLPAWRFCPYCAGAAEPTTQRATRRARPTPGKVAEFPKSS